MKSRNTGRMVIVIAPLIFVLVAGALYFSVTASREEYRLGRSMDQIVTVVEFARQMNIKPHITPQDVLKDFFTYFKGYSSSYADTSTANSLSTGRLEQTLINGWGDPLWITFYPAQQLIRLEMALTPVRCQKFVMFYAEDTDKLGLQSLDISYGRQGAQPQNVYSSVSKGHTDKISPDLVARYCHGHERPYVSLTFFTFKPAPAT
ncbi:MAG: hypothetical protein FWF24_06970 [Alphaproteobacteria bacterium]|nr:hypothetical protein [Alphaproteobacteria bacterium]